MAVEFSSPAFRRGKPEIVTRYLAMRADHPKLMIKSLRLAGSEAIATNAAGQIVVREHRDRRVAIERRLVELRAKLAMSRANELLSRVAEEPLRVDLAAERRQGIASLNHAAAELQESVRYWSNLRADQPRQPRN
jgi:hypothetical protein